ncbi:MAG: GTP-binding protein, partial [Acidimicrobiales bacterium]
PPGGAYELTSVARRLDAISPAGPPTPSVAFVEVEGEGDPKALGSWAREVLGAHGRRLLRLQAVSSLRGRPERWALSAVRTISSSGLCGPAPSGARRARALAVGHDLDVDFLERSLSHVVRTSP